MIEGQTVAIPADEYLARPTIVAWLAYPGSEYKRNGALRHIKAWAEFKRDCHEGLVDQGYDSRGAPILTTRQVRIEEGLRGLERAVNLQLIMGRYYYYRLLDHESEIFSAPPVSVSGNEFSRKAFWRGLNDSGMMEIDERNARGRLWNDRMRSMNLAVGAGIWWRGPHYPGDGTGSADAIEAWKKMPRPDLDTLLFGGRPWALRALNEAEKVRSLATRIRHPSSSDLLHFYPCANF